MSGMKLRGLVTFVIYLVNWSSESHYSSYIPMTNGGQVDKYTEIDIPSMALNLRPHKRGARSNFKSACLTF